MIWRFIKHITLSRIRIRLLAFAYFVIKLSRPVEMIRSTASLVDSGAFASRINAFCRPTVQFSLCCRFRTFAATIRGVIQNGIGNFGYRLPEDGFWQDNRATFGVLIGQSTVPFFDKKTILCRQGRTPVFLQCPLNVAPGPVGIGIDSALRISSVRCLDQYQEWSRQRPDRRL